MATWAEDVQTALKNLNGIATLAAIYGEVRKIRPRPHPNSFNATVRGTIERNSSDSQAFSSGKDLFFSVHGLGAGIWGSRSILKETPIAGDIGDLPIGTESPDRVPQTISRILRETELARKIKLLHNDVCQLCETVVQVSGKTYSEAHHIKPLGKPHFGPDIPGNIIVVCPNCHVALDFFSRKLASSELKAVHGHVISEEFVAYNNKRVSEI